MIQIDIPDGADKVIIRRNVNIGIPLALFFNCGDGVEYFLNEDGSLSKATTVKTPLPNPIDEETELPKYLEVRGPGDSNFRVYQRL